MIFQVLTGANARIFKQLKRYSKNDHKMAMSLKACTANNLATVVNIRSKALQTGYIFDLLRQQSKTL